MSIVCSHCTALHWIDERTQGAGSTAEHPLFNTCCNRGDVSVSFMRPLPPLLYSLFYDTTTLAIHFHTHIRKYNSALAFVSLQYQLDRRVLDGLQCFQIHGALYDRSGPLEHGHNIRPPSYFSMILMMLLCNFNFVLVVMFYPVMSISFSYTNS